MDCPYKPGDLLRIRPDRREIGYVQSWVKEGGDPYGSICLERVEGGKTNPLLVFHGCWTRGVFEEDVELAEGPW